MKKRRKSKSKSIKCDICGEIVPSRGLFFHKSNHLVIDPVKDDLNSVKKPILNLVKLPVKPVINPVKESVVNLVKPTVNAVKTPLNSVKEVVNLVKQEVVRTKVRPEPKVWDRKWLEFYGYI